jgi:phosphoglycerate dehydrogenase-like enzyme
MKIVAIAGLDEEKFNFLKKKYKSIKIINITDSNFFKNKNINGLLVFGEWAVKKNLSAFLNKKFSFFKKIEWVHLSRAGIDEFINLLPKYKFKFTCGKTIQGPNVSEHCIALLLNLTRGIYDYDKTKFRPTEIYKKKVLVTGLGGIGVSVAEKLNSFGAIVSAAETGLKPCYSFVKDYYDISELKQIVNEFDIVINTTPLTKKTFNLFNKDIFKRMKDGVFFVNVSRGDIVNTADLKDYVKKNKFSGVGLDIIGSEDFVQINPFEKYKNVIFTNHLAGITTDNLRRFDLLEKNLRNYINNDFLINVVDKKKQY